MDKSKPVLHFSFGLDDNGLPTYPLFMLSGKPSDKLAMLDLISTKISEIKENLLDEIHMKANFFSSADVDDTPPEVQEQEDDLVEINHTPEDKNRNIFEDLKDLF